MLRLHQCSSLWNKRKKQFAFLIRNCKCIVNVFHNLTQYHSVNVKLSTLQLHKLNSATKSVIKITLKLWPNIIVLLKLVFHIIYYSFSHNLLLNDKRVSNLWKAFANTSSPYIKFPKTQLSKIIQPIGFLCNLLGQLLKVDLSLMKIVLTPFAKSVLIPLGLTAATSAADAQLHKKLLISETSVTLIVLNKEI